MIDGGKDDVPLPLLHQVYVAEFRVHAVALIWLSYRRLKTSDFVTAEEDDITGELARMARQVLEDPTSPEWVDHYDVREQSPQNVAGKQGKRRPKMDIEVERHQRGIRPCLGFEAKRLGQSHPIGRYLGTEGLNAFLTGYYPTTHGDAGMIGYLQESKVDWATKLTQELARNPHKHRIVQGCELEQFDAQPNMPAFRTGHTDLQGRRLDMIHVLLPFTI